MYILVTLAIVCLFVLFVLFANNFFCLFILFFCVPFQSYLLPRTWNKRVYKNERTSIVFALWMNVLWSRVCVCTHGDKQECYCACVCCVRICISHRICILKQRVQCVLSRKRRRNDCPLVVGFGAWVFSWRISFCIVFPPNLVCVILFLRYSQALTFCVVSCFGLDFDVNDVKYAKTIIVNALFYFNMQKNCNLIYILVYFVFIFLYFFFCLYLLHSLSFSVGVCLFLSTYLYDYLSAIKHIFHIL